VQIERSSILVLDDPTLRRRTVGAVEHAIKVLRCISGARGSLGVNEVARRIGIHKSSVSRLVSTLESHDLVQRDPETERLSLGIGLVVLAAPVLTRLGVDDLARQHLAQLAQDSGETVSFSIWDGSHAVSIEQALGAGAVRTFAEPGRRNPGHSTAAGKMLLAHAGRNAIADYCAGPLKRFSQHTITDAKALEAELDLTRCRGYAINLGELEEDVGAVSAAVHDGTGRVVGSVTATVPLYRFDPDRQNYLIALVLRTANDLSAKLGHQSHPAHT